MTLRALSGVSLLTSAFRSLLEASLTGVSLTNLWRRRNTMGINRELVRRLGSSKFNYWFGYVANLSLVAWLLSHVVKEGRLVLSPGALAGYALVGLLSWTFSEYVLHRYVYHEWTSFLTVGHELHHKHPRELIGVPWWLTSIVLIAIYEGLASVLNPATTGVVMGFNWFGYILYCISHHGSHHWSFRNPWLQWVKRNHHLHHAYSDYNWGFTTPLWDLVFGTSLPADPAVRRQLRERMVEGGHASTGPSQESASLGVSSGLSQ